jgi:catechol 2,3-dioxygenase-like lactoylglutathione lyase family enzyme
MIAGSAVAAEPPADRFMAPVKASTLLNIFLPSSNLERSIAFYTKGLGLIEGAQDLHPGLLVPLQFPGGGTVLVLEKTEGAAASQPSASRPSSNMVIAVPDMKALEARLGAAGYRLTGPISRQPGLHLLMAAVQDPDGNRIRLFQRID